MVGPYYNNLQKINPYRVEHAAATDTINDATTASKMIIKLSDILIY
jgi:hypothetical protein